MLHQLTWCGTQDPTLDAAPNFRIFLQILYYDKASPLAPDHPQNSAAINESAHGVKFQAVPIFQIAILKISFHLLPQ